MHARQISGAILIPLACAAGDNLGMETTHDANGSTGSTGSAGSAGFAGSAVESASSAVRRTSSDMWANRPPRIPEKQGGKAVLAGVCEGIGVRYQIDPVVVRVAFVALSFVFGGGLLLYFLCWINMPRFGMTLTPWEAVITPKDQLDEVGKKEKETGWALAIVLFFFILTAGGVGEYGLAGTFTTLTLGLLGWWGLHSRLPQAPYGVLAQSQITAARPGAATVADVTTGAGPAPDQMTAILPPAAGGSTIWRPGSGAISGSAPPVTSSNNRPSSTRPPNAFPMEETAELSHTSASSPNVDTSHLSPPEGYPHPAAGRTTPPAWDPLGTVPELWHLPDLEPQQQSGKQKKTKMRERKRRNRPFRFWIPVSIALALFTATLIAVGDSVRYYNFDEDAQGVGDIEVKVDELEMLPPIRRIVGETTLDLTSMEPLDTESVLEVGNYVGTMNIVLPDNVPVYVKCDVGIGTTDCPNPIERINEDAEGEALVIDARQFIGSVVVREE